MQLTKNFSLHEFAVSDSRPDLAVDVVFDDEETYRVYILCMMFLQPIRESFGPVNILSGKRTVALNKAVGGSPNSDHLYNSGFTDGPVKDKVAADFTVPRTNLEDVYRFVKIKYPKETYGQLIYYRKQRFIHLSLPTNTRQGESWINE